MSETDVRVRVPPSAQFNDGDYSMRILTVIILISTGFSQAGSNISASSLFAAGEFIQARETILQTIESGSENHEYFKLAAEIFIRLDDLENANSYLTKAIELAPKNTEYRERWESLNDMRSRLNESKKSFDNGFTDESIMNYEKTIQAYPEFALAFYNFGLTYFKLNEFDLAVENFRKASELNPFEIKYTSSISNIGAKLTQQGNEEYRRRDYDLALDYYQQAVRYVPEFSEARFKSALIMNKLGDYENAKSTLHKNLEIDPQHLQSYKLLGDVYSRLGDLENALVWYGNAVKINSKYDKAYYALGKTYINLGKFAEAESELKNAINVNPEYSKAYESLGFIYSSREEYKSAADQYLLAVKFNPKSFDAYSRLASAYNAQGMFSQARDAAKTSLDLKKKNAGASYELGVAEKALGNIAAAKSAFESATRDKKWRKIAKYELTMIEKGL